MLAGHASCSRLPPVIRQAYRSSRQAPHWRFLVVLMPIALRLGGFGFGFLIGQQLLQPIVMDLISRRITFRLSHQPSVVCKVLLVDVALHCDL